MVIDRIKEAFSSSDEKYEILFHKYSQVKLENKRLKDQYHKDMKEYKDKTQEEMANYLIRLYEEVEEAKNDSFNIKSMTKEVQKMLLDVNKVEKTVKEMMKEFSIEEIVPEERQYDPEYHEVASYQDAKGMAKGIIVKTPRKGFKFKGKILKKPKVVVTK